MNSILLAAISLPSLQTLGLWFIGFAMICLVVWGCVKLVNSTGVNIPEPVKICFVVIVGIFLLLLMAKLLGLAG